MQSALRHAHLLWTASWAYLLRLSKVLSSLFFSLSKIRTPGIDWYLSTNTRDGYRLVSIHEYARRRTTPFGEEHEASLLSLGVAERKRLNLGNLNPIYERELTKLDVHQEEGRWNVSKDGAGRRGCRHK